MKIPIKAFRDDSSLSWEERFNRLLAHHEEETKFLIGKINELERIPMSGIDSFKKGLAILEKYEVTSMCAEHDVVYLLTKEEVSDEDRALLDNDGEDDSLIGWHWADEADSFGFFT